MTSRLKLCQPQTTWTKVEENKDDKSNVKVIR